MKRIACIFGVIVLIAAPAVAAPIDVPTSLKLGYGQEVDGERINPVDEWGDDGIHAAVTLEGDMLEERELDTGGEAEGMFYAAKVTVPLWLLGQWDWYGQAGMATDVEIKSRAAGSPVRYELDDAFSWGAGANYVLFQDTENDWGVFADAKYRAIEDADYDGFTAGGSVLTPSRSDEAQWQEWQAALGIAKRWTNLLVYGGAKGSDVSIDADITAGGTRYELDDAESDMMGGGFAGLSFQVSESVSLDVEGHMGDETAYDGKVVLKF